MKLEASQLTFIEMLEDDTTAMSQQCSIQPPPSVTMANMKEEDRDTVM